jgi:AcrR family transcriptional regulator
MGTAKDSKETKKRLIEAAGQLFAEKGFKKVTVREIVKKAETHLSAMNYHFSSKEILYQEVLSYACESTAIKESDKKLLLDLHPAEAIFQLTKHSLLENRGELKHNWQRILANREYANPSKFYDSLVKKFLNAEIDFICRLIAKHLNRDAKDDKVIFLAFSWIGLVEVFGSNEHLTAGYNQDFDRKGEESDRFAHMIVDLLFKNQD